MTTTRRPRLSLAVVIALVACLAVLLNQLRPVGRSEAIRIATNYVRTNRPDLSLDGFKIEAEVLGLHDDWAVSFSKGEVVEEIIRVKKNGECNRWEVEQNIR
jgi:hypothetical protein